VFNRTIAYRDSCPGDNITFVRHFQRKVICKGKECHWQPGSWLTSRSFFEGHDTGRVRDGPEIPWVFEGPAKRRLHVLSDPQRSKEQLRRLSFFTNGDRVRQLRK
jgi:hypothetical protein